MFNKSKTHISAAKRKTGFTAYKMYAVGFFLALIYIYFVSIPVCNNYIRESKTTEIDSPAKPKQTHTILFEEQALSLFPDDPVKRAKWIKVKRAKLAKANDSVPIFFKQIKKSLIRVLEKNDIVFSLSGGMIILMLYILMGTKYGFIRETRFIPNRFYVFSLPFFGTYIYCVNIHNVSFLPSLWIVSVVLIPPFVLFTLEVAIFVGKEAFKEMRLYERLTKTFSGRSSGRWGGFLSYWWLDITKVFSRSMGRKIRKTKHSPILIGKTFMEYDYKIFGRYIGTSSEQHLITIAGSGAGKSYTMANNVLSSYCGGIVAFDLKGEHTNLNYERRAAYAPCYVLDPFKITGKPCFKWNPFDEIEPDSDTARSDLILIVESLVIREKGDDKPHFIEVPRIVIRGFMAHIMTTYPKEKQTLISLYELVAEVSAADDNARAIIEEMKENEAIGNSPRDAAHELEKFNDKSGVDHWATITRSLDWINDPAMKEVINGHDFSFSACKTENATVFLALPDVRLQYFSRFIRLFFSMAFVRLNESTTRQPQGSERRVLFVLDEFHALGEFSLIEHAFNIGRSSHLKMWVILQNIGQLTQVYDNASNFLGSADLQAFGIAAIDNETVRMLSESLGNYTDDENRPVPRGETEPKLMSEGDIPNFLDAKQYNQIFIPFKGYPLRLKRVKTLQENIFARIFKAIFTKIFKTISVPILKGLISGLKIFGILLFFLLVFPFIGFPFFGEEEILDDLTPDALMRVPYVIRYFIVLLLIFGIIFGLFIGVLIIRDFIRGYYAHYLSH